MIKFILGRSGYGKSAAVLDGIKNDIENGKKVYLIVPEQQAVTWESRAVRELPPSAFLSLDIVGFSRLADLVARRFGGINYNYIKQGEKALVLWSAILAAKDNLKIYASNPGQEDRLVPMLLDAIAELKRHKITPAMLEDASEELREDDDVSSSRLADRIDDLSLIYSIYETLLNERFDDADDELAKLEKTLSQRDFFSGTSVYIDSYHSLAPTQYGIIECIMRQADDVTVTFTYDKDSVEPHFSFTEKNYDVFRSIAAKLSLETETVVLKDDCRRDSEALRYLEKNLWNYSSDEYSGSCSADEIKIIKCADRYDEAQAAACEIRKLISRGARYRDIALIGGNIDKLRGIIDTALDAENIPYHISRRSELSAEPAARLIFAALSIASGGWRAEDVIACAKTALFRLTDDEINSFEKYVTSWRINGRHSYENPWHMSPDGYTEEFTERSAAMLCDVNSAREKITLPLIHFCDTVAGGAISITTLCKACYDLLCELDVYSYLEEQAARLDSVSKSDEAIKCRQVFSAICSALDTVALTLPDAKADTAGFARLLRRIVEDTDIGTIPAAADEIILGSASSVRTDDVKYVFILGAVDGEFPAIPEEKGFFSDADKIMLEGCNITLSERTDELTRKEMFSFYRAVTSASHGVRVFVPASDSGAVCRPSDGAERIMTLFPSAQSVNWSDAAPDDMIWSAASLLRTAAQFSGDEELCRAAGEFVSIPKDQDSFIYANKCTISPETSKLIFPSHMSLSQSRLDTYVLCHFGYFCKYILKLSEEKKAAIRAVDIGNFIHRILELYFLETKDKDLPLPDDEISAITDRLINEYVATVTHNNPSARVDYLFSRLKKNVGVFIRVLNREFAQAEFRPYKFELPIAMGGDDTPSPLVFTLEDGSTVTLRGKIDRLDVYDDGNGKTYVRVVDYKTGHKSFSLKEIAMGLNMQLLLYLFTICGDPASKFKDELAGDNEIVPAGVLYMNTQPTEQNVSAPPGEDETWQIAEKSVSRSGLLIDDIDILKKMDRDLSGCFIPVKLNKDGTISKKSSVASLLGFGELYEAISDNICAITTKMRSGQMQAKPIKARSQDPCKYCQMKAICRISDKDKMKGVGDGGQEMDGGTASRD